MNINMSMGYVIVWLYGDAFLSPRACAQKHIQANTPTHTHTHALADAVTGNNV